MGKREWERDFSIHHEYDINFELYVNNIIDACDPFSNERAFCASLQWVWKGIQQWWSLCNNTVFITQHSRYVIKIWDFVGNFNLNPSSFRCYMEKLSLRNLNTYCICIQTSLLPPARVAIQTLQLTKHVEYLNLDVKFASFFTQGWFSSLHQPATPYNPVELSLFIPLHFQWITCAPLNAFFFAVKWFLCAEKKSP